MTVETQTSDQDYNQTLQQATCVYGLLSIHEAIKWMHTVCGYPVKSTWVKADKAGNYIGWPLLTTENIKKYYPETDYFPKGHMTQAIKNVQSTKGKPTPVNIYKTNKLSVKKERDIYTKAYDVQEIMFSDQRGQFPTKSQKGNK